MYKLLMAGKYRVRTNLIYKIIGIVAVCLGIYGGVFFLNSEFPVMYDNLLLVFLVMLTSIINSAMEYSNHAIQNKLVVGYNRREILLAEILVNIRLTCIYVTGFVIGFVVMAGGVLGEMDKSSALKYLEIFATVNISISVLSTVVGMLFATHLAGIVLSLVIILASFFVGMMIEMTTFASIEYEVGKEQKVFHMRIRESGKIGDGMSGEILETVCEILPYGQFRNCYISEMAFMEIGTMEGVSGFDESWWLKYSLYSLIFSGIMTGIGLAAFGKKDIK